VCETDIRKGSVYGVLRNNLINSSSDERFVFLNIHSKCGHDIHVAINSTI